MELLVGHDWKDFFDVVIVQARKPRFFTDESRPMRLYDEQSGSHVWDRVTRLDKGTIYYEVWFVKHIKLLALQFKLIRAQLNNCKN